MTAVQLLATLVIILVAAELFTNALEHLGERLGISEGVTGSLFAAVGTALPETLVPILAITGSTGNGSVSDEIGVGAILGAPLMLSTLSTCLMAAVAFGKRGASGHIAPEPTGLKRDLDFFLFAFAVATAAMFIPHAAWSARAALSVVLVATYVWYIVATVRASKGLVAVGHGTEAPGTLLLTRLRLPANGITLAVQLGAALVLLVIGAEGFIDGVRDASTHFGISALLLSLLIVPIATELPEKVNSILWVRRGKDTLAFGNITGAMVFQGTLLPAIGILLTPWQPRIEVLTGVIATLAAALWLRLNANGQRGIALWALMVNGALYVGYLAIMLTR
ncbi:sodium:calcium antiporter [Chitinasiproducens palmae]|uniref:Cation:H+ antiporter n=1 Tax=Chitinasiproducens palmae TaxID=1770053 RepID=A0A1H2PVU9_9BURK|nr:sodium:calcium antiporter [Chitinasiproducens palmae]SDV51003.1 cation:H+ antiporter [Chitinasiproducens palmae]